jgi:hypothetical protein
VSPKSLIPPPWFVDWTGEDCAIIASGPSTKRVDVAALRGKMRVIAIKENIELFPWADVLYGCDAAWWRNANGMPKFTGLKVSATPRVTMRFPDIQIIGIADPSGDKLVLTKPGIVGSGGNSGFQALNLAVQFGAKRILLVGFDMSDHYGVHWYGRANGNGRSNPAEWNFRRWRAAFGFAAEQLKTVGVQVLNASELSVLTCFPKTTLEQALLEWRI